MIPNLAIHMNGNNDGYKKYNAQTDMLNLTNILQKIDFLVAREHRSRKGKCFGKRFVFV